MTPCFSVVITGDQTEYKYYISLGAPLHDIPELSQECLDGNTTVCQYKHENTFERSIGTQAAKSMVSALTEHCFLENNYDL